MLFIYLSSVRLDAFLFIFLQIQIYFLTRIFETIEVIIWWLSIYSFFRRRKSCVKKWLWSKVKNMQESIMQNTKTYKSLYWLWNIIKISKCCCLRQIWKFVHKEILLVGYRIRSKLSSKIKWLWFISKCR